MKKVSKRKYGKSLTTRNRAMTRSPDVFGPKTLAAEASSKKKIKTTKHIRMTRADN